MLRINLAFNIQKNAKFNIPPGRQMSTFDFSDKLIFKPLRMDKLNCIFEAENYN
jgi:hypothetical protein